MKKFLKNNYFLSFCVGLLSVFSLAPFNIFIFMMASFSGFYLLLEKEEIKNSLKSTFWLGFFYGFGAFVGGIYWISISLLVDAKSFAWLIPFSVTIIPAFLAIYIGLTALIYRKICMKFDINLIYQKIIIFASLFVIFEILRSHLFTGFSWNLVGYSMMFSDYSSQSANIFGIYGLSFLTVLFSMSPVLFIEKSKKNMIFLIFLVFVFIINIVYGYFRVNDKKLSYFDSEARIVQGNIKQSLKWDPILKYRNFLKHIDISGLEENKKLKMIVWPETAVPYAIGVSKDLTSQLRKVVDENSFLITGALRFEFKDSIKTVDKAYNSIFVIDGKGGDVKYYDKHHLVPFGEYVPLQKFLPFIDKITGGGEGFSSGDGPKTIEMDEIKFSPLVCYEVIFSDKIIDSKNRPDLLVNLTNDGWFGRSSGPFQHFNMTRLRSIEYAIPLIRAANSGISAYIDPFGRVVKKIDLNKTGFIDFKLIKPLKETIYSQFKYFGVLLLLLIFNGFLILEKRFRSYNH